MLGNGDPPLEVGLVSRVPPIAAEWDDPAWQGIPSFALPRNEPLARAPRYQTQVKWVHDGKTLALLIHAVEPEPVVARAGGRDSLVTQDDHVAIYLATTGSAFLQIAFNSVGALRDAKAIGPHITEPQADWNSSVEVQTNIRYGGWTARLNIPLLDCAKALGEGGIPDEWRVVISRYRAPRPGEAAELSSLPVTNSALAYGPVRYRRMQLRHVPPSRVALPERPYTSPPKNGLAGELASLDPCLVARIPPLQRYSNDG